MAKSSPRGASRSGGRAPASRRQLPGWLWLFTGLAAGLFIAFIYHLAQIQRQENSVAHDTKPAKIAPAKTAKPGDKPLPKFDFYAVLPKMEVILPREDADDSKSTATPSDASKSSQQQSAKQPSSSSSDKGRFLLQAGSFRDSADAERLRAEFTLDGFSVHVQPGVLDSGDTWYRVMIGPFSNKNDLRAAQTRLSARNVETLPIQVKGQ